MSDSDLLILVAVIGVGLYLYTQSQRETAASVTRDNAFAPSSFDQPYPSDFYDPTNYQSLEFSWAFGA
jgi:hypothetical protein